MLIKLLVNTHFENLILCLSLFLIGVHPKHYQFTACVCDELNMHLIEVRQYCGLIITRFITL